MAADTRGSLTSVWRVWPMVRPAAALPGGDPLAAALAAGETPSPEMVAAAGEPGAIEKWHGLLSLAGVTIGLALVCWLAQRAYLVNHVGLDRHPESLTDTARQ